MLFSSVEFLFGLLPLTLLGFRLALRHGNGEAAQAVLLAASVVFLGWWNWRYLPLFGASILVNYGLSVHLTRTRSSLVALAGVAFNVGLLAYFKYADFAIGLWNVATGSRAGLLHLVLPLGISFYTLQQLGYVVDCWTGRQQGHYGLLRYALFTAFFPQLIAGPIVLHQEVVPQFERFGWGYHVTAECVGRALFLLAAGLFKKVIVADTIAKYVVPAFADVGDLGFYDAWTAALGYTLQLYFDFSGYGDIAMGLGGLFGVDIVANFRSPYKASNIQEFWRRWHITLGRFLKQYLYIPLGGSRRGFGRTLLAAAGTMLVGGLWHGAGCQFVLWGAVHAAMMAVFLLWRRSGRRVPEGLARALTFLGVMLAWVLFRANSVKDALTVYAAMFGAKGLSLPVFYLAAFPALKRGVRAEHSVFYGGTELLAFLCLLAFVMKARSTPEVAASFVPCRRVAAALGGAMTLVVFHLGAPSDFLYWAF